MRWGLLMGLVILSGCGGESTAGAPPSSSFLSSPTSTPALTSSARPTATSGPIGYSDLVVKQEGDLAVTITALSAHCTATTPAAECRQAAVALGSQAQLFQRALTAFAVPTCMNGVDAKLRFALQLLGEAMRAAIAGFDTGKYEEVVRAVAIEDQAATYLPTDTDVAAAFAGCMNN